MSVSDRSTRRDLRALFEPESVAVVGASDDPAGARRPGARPRRGEYVLWMELWVRALQEPDLLPECEALSRRWRGYFFEAVRRGAEPGEFSPVSDPDEAAERLIAQVDGLGFELLLGYSWTSPERMRERLYGFAAEQLGIERRALERDAKKVVALLGEERS